MVQHYPVGAANYACSCRHRVSFWQKGATAAPPHEESLAEVLKILDVYADVAENIMAMPVIKGMKTLAEKFAGAAPAAPIEAMMQNWPHAAAMRIN